MRKFSILFIIIILASFSATSQNVAQKLLPLIPQERVYIHHNTTELFTGERLYYKIYVFDTSTKMLSEISKVAYVNLIDENGESIFKHKLKLENGKGYGDFFIPTSVLTGTYKLIGYSQWMKNGSLETIFQTDLKIINPYKPASDQYLELVNIDNGIPSSFSEQNTFDNVSDKKPIVENSLMDFSISKKTATTRDKVTLRFSGLGENTIKGNYSISVRQRSIINTPDVPPLQDFFMEFQKEVITNYKKGDSFYLPELRGEIIAGKVTNVNNNKPAQNIKVSLSVPGKNYLFSIATTDINGQFYFNIDQQYSSEVASLQLLVEDNTAYTIKTDVQSLDYKEFSFNNFKISSDLEEVILERSIQNQLENAYSQVRNDSIVQSFHEQPFYVNLDETYLLDNYNRFFTIRETVVEIVNHVSVQNKNGERVFQVRPPGGGGSSGIDPILFVDGLFIENHENFMDYNAKQIKSISFSRPKYLLGSKLFQGIISIETIKGDFSETFYAPDINKINLLKPEPKKMYFLQQYNGDTTKKTERIPDYRHQLLWNPDLEIKSSNMSIDFYTSDVMGDYEVMLNGVTESGQAISIKKEFSVK